METQQITSILQEIFPQDTVETNNEENWQINNDKIRLLVLLSEDKSWLRVLTPIASVMEAQSLLVPLMEANFDTTQEIRYALGQNVLWGVFHHNFATLATEDFVNVILRMIFVAEKGLSEAFQQLVEQRIRQIIQAAKTQGQSKEATFQTLERFYQEGMLGDIDRDPQERENFLASWQMQLDRLWDEE
ncbi:conserved hypothetical protein [Hyella patelloides LEGE 07179]|uniref:DNA-binding domain-containing protein n=1 Tax=Hyella patelloides LEGE 07179 TaxID=945734 RepID=A0A563VXQ7_9CYAN|nr:hypothetical protein [Hyella patelloides]VEP16209.1 conserved hypothetical protein [Hyella patelloides LEGE 07179]